MTIPQHRFLAGPLPQAVEDALSRLAAAPGVRALAVMPDVHLAEDVCIGTVVATDGRIYPAAVGGDIGCGVLALRTDARAESLHDAAKAARVLAGFYDRIPRDRHREANLPAWPEALDPAGRPPAAPPLASLARHDGRAQLGTLGSGNHFLELQRDDDDGLWVMLHSGSRGMGPAIRASYQRRGEPSAGGLVSLADDSSAGRDYLHDMAWAIEYARASRALMLRAALDVLEDVLGAAPVPSTLVECDHNHVRRERHGSEERWVHRKGAIPAGLDVPGLIPGSMGSPSYHVAGRGSPDGLASSSHGAGRLMSRSEARRRISARDVARQLEGVWWDHRKAAAFREESPAAYKDIGEVMRAQHALTRIVRRVTPVLCYKGT